ncbi:UNVERIFIED_CONTAM: hypothetical protein HDU68_000795 [Siphonaria sp. JEL0065]|nr:hypothetical protein HDU68_000795 [Siphonaria sp. JEL0065]
MPSLEHAAAAHLAKRYIVYGYGGYGLYGGLGFLFFLILLIVIISLCTQRKTVAVEVPVQPVVYTTPVESLPTYTPAYATYSSADQVVYGTAQQQQQQIFHRAPVDTGSDQLGTYAAPGYSNPNYYPAQGSTPANQTAASPTLNVGVQR